MPAMDNQTKLLGLLGYPLTHSLSPVMQNAALRSLKLNYFYIPFQVEPQSLKMAVQGLKVLGVAGYNVTIPFKEQVLGLMDVISPEAELIGAVNTVVNQQGKLFGYNTDGSGFTRSLQEELGMGCRGKAVVLIGAGGAGRAVAFALALQGVAHIHIANRTLSHADQLAEDIRTKTGCGATSVGLNDPALQRVIAQADIFINASPIGMYPNNNQTLPVQEELLKPPLIVCDLIYNPAATNLLQAAAKNGCQTLNGIGMLVYQGAEAFKLWTGSEAPVPVMREALENSLSL